MSYFSSSNARFTRGRILASAAVLALVASGAMGEMAWSQSSADHAPASVSLSESQAQSAPSMPSFAPLIARVKPAVVAVQVKIANVSADTNDLRGRMDKLPPEIQQFFKRFGEPNGALSPRSIDADDRSGLRLLHLGRRLYRDE